LSKIRLRVLAIASYKNPKKREKLVTTQSTSKSRIWGAETPKPIDTIFCMSGAVYDINTHANFCEGRLRGFAVAIGRILGFSIELLRRLYNYRASV